MPRFVFLAMVGLASCLAQKVADPRLAPIRTADPTPSLEQARIATEDGTPFAVSPQIIVLSPCQVSAVFGSGLVQFRPVYRWVGEDESDNRTTFDPPCQVKIVAAGYRGIRARLWDGELIVLKRLGTNEGSGVSIHDVWAPAEARKEYQWGEQDLARKKWAQAEEHLEKAVALYPEFATAWSELAAARQRQAKTVQAEQALKRAIEVEPKYLKPYAQLATLLGDQRRWGDSIEVAERALLLKPVEFPQVYCEHARASLQLGKLDAAEKSAREAIANDLDRVAPQAEYILGEALEAKGDRMGAVAQMKRYLTLDKRGAYAEQAKKRLAEWK